MKHYLRLLDIIYASRLSILEIYFCYFQSCVVYSLHSHLTLMGKVSVEEVRELTNLYYREFLFFYPYYFSFEFFRSNSDNRSVLVFITDILSTNY